MSLRFTIGLCTIIVGVCSLTLCQPPTPRITRIELSPFPAVNNAETKDIFTASNQAERVIQVRDLDDPLSNFSKRSR